MRHLKAWGDTHHLSLSYAAWGRLEALTFYALLSPGWVLLLLAGLIRDHGLVRHWRGLLVSPFILLILLQVLMALLFALFPDS